MVIDSSMGRRCAKRQVFGTQSETRPRSYETNASGQRVASVAAVQAEAGFRKNVCRRRERAPGWLSMGRSMHDQPGRDGNAAGCAWLSSGQAGRARARRAEQKANGGGLEIDFLRANMTKAREKRKRNAEEGQKRKDLRRSVFSVVPALSREDQRSISQRVPSARPPRRQRPCRRRRRTHHRPRRRRWPGQCQAWSRIDPLRNTLARRGRRKRSTVVGVCSLVTAWRIFTVLLSPAV